MFTHCPPHVSIKRIACMIEIKWKLKLNYKRPYVPFFRKYLVMWFQTSPVATEPDYQYSEKDLSITGYFWQWLTRFITVVRKERNLITWEIFQAVFCSNMSNFDFETAFIKLWRQIIEAVAYVQKAHWLLSLYLQTCLFYCFKAYSHGAPTTASVSFFSLPKQWVLWQCRPICSYTDTVQVTANAT